MGDVTSISWTDATWNPVRGCSRVSDGCRRCSFAGFAALPPGPGETTAYAKRSWRDVLGIALGEMTFPKREQLDNAKVAHRKLIRENHPDVGGDHAIAAEINAALTKTERELGGAA